MTSGEYQRPPLKVALMGLGRSMFESHYPVFRAHPELFKVAFACDLVKERRDLVARDYPDCRMFRRFSDMLDEREIDLVDIATCSADHVPHALMSLKRGFWTLLETPMALTLDDAMVLKGASVKAKNRLMVLHRGLFEPDFMLARRTVSDPRLGAVHQVVVRRDDWQCVKRLGGGAAYYAMTDLILQALKLLPLPPIQMWSELKRIASLGDAEDYAHICLKTRDGVSADVEFSGGALPGDRSPSFTIRGDRGVFKVFPGASEGEILAIDPGFKFPRRRSSVRTPGFGDRHEDFPIVREAVRLDGAEAVGDLALWRAVYETVRTAAPFPIPVEDAIEAVKFAHLMKKTSPFGK